ncbi:MAG: hypothetical protein GF398_04810 [Chitinivibrionales bacterium]|nr:hypothetical protein [Chitinivibrionales bacterium]
MMCSKDTGNPATPSGQPLDSDTTTINSGSVDSTLQHSLPSYTVTQALDVYFIGTWDWSTWRDSTSFWISNDSSGSLFWDIRSPSWMEMTPRSDTGDSRVSLKIDRSAMAPGVYRDTFTIASNGGDTSLYIEVIIPADTPGRAIDEFWPMAVGNSWVWMDTWFNTWWALEVVDSAVVDSFTLWNVRGEDSNGGTGNYWFTIANDLLMVLDDSSRAHSLGTDWGSSNCAVIDCWNGSMQFSIFESSIAPGLGGDPYWKTGIQYIPGSLEMLTNKYPIWSVGNMADTQFICGNVDDCIGLRERDVSGDSLYTILVPGWGPVVWDGMHLIKAVIDDKTVGSVPSDMQAYHIASNPDTSSDLLWWFRCDDGSYIHVMGYRDNGLTVPNHIIFEDQNSEVVGVVSFRADFMPVQWITDSATISVRNIIPDTTNGADSSWDPHTAFHFVTGVQTEKEFIADIYPSTPSAAIDSLHILFCDIYRDCFNHLWFALEDAHIKTWDDLIAVALYADSNRIWWQSAALFLAMGASITAMEAAPSGINQAMAKSRAVAALGIYVPEPVKGMVKQIGTYLKDEAMCKWCPKQGVPTVEMLQCQGLKTVLAFGQVCHDSYMFGKTAVDCVNLCKASTKCFTNICMPRNVAVADFEKSLWENNLKVTPKEMRDLVKQNWDSIKPWL